VSLQFFDHPFSSYTWKVADRAMGGRDPLNFRMLGPDYRPLGAPDRD
jgi:hypothetical protein